jgi:hypothetical protein
MTTRETREQRTPPGTEPTDEDLRRDIELTRQELGATVAALAHKADVKGRARQVARQRVDAARGRLPQPVFVQAASVLATMRRHPLAAATAGVCAGLGVLVLREVLRRRC